MTPSVAIIAQGSMGAAVGTRLTEHQVTVLTSLTGRSEASGKRAREAGMKAVSDRELAEADFFLSIVPPGEALALAERLEPALHRRQQEADLCRMQRGRPGTVNQIKKVIAATGCPFVGAGIIGPPPKPGTANTKFYASGPQAGEFAKLNEYGLIVRVLDRPSHLRRSAENVLCRHHQGLHRVGRRHDACRHARRFSRSAKAELAESQPALLGFLSRSVTSMYAKAYRWVAELDEIGTFVGDDFRRARHAGSRCAAL